MYKAFIPDPVADSDFDLSSDAVTAVTRATTALADLDRSPPKLTSLEGLARQLLRAESLASSRIEGLQLSHRRIAHATYQGAKSHDQRANDIIGNIDAMERAVELASQTKGIAVEDIQDIHRTLLRFSVDHVIAGKLRTTQGWIGGSELSPLNASFIPPPASYVPGLMEDLCAFINRDELPEIVQAAIVHAQFETIHPFADGNGRVGRGLIHVIFRRRGISSLYVPPLSLVLAAQRKAYIGALTEYREGDINEWIAFFAAAAAASATEANRLAMQVEALESDWIERLGKPRRDATVRQIVAELPAYPVIDTGIAAQVTGKSVVAVTNALNQLEEAVVLMRVDDKKWGRAWECPELFDLITRFERDLTVE